LHYTDRNHPDHQGIVEAVQKSEQVLHEINEAVRVEESRRRLAYYEQNLMVVSSGFGDVSFVLLHFLHADFY